MRQFWVRNIYFHPVFHRSLLISMTRLFLFACAGLFAPALFAQSPSPTLVNTCGGTITSNSHQLDWALGELAIHTLLSSSNGLTQGFLQPVTITVSVLHEPLLYKVRAYPTPVSEWLHFQTDLDITKIQVYDMAGKMAMSMPYQPTVNLNQLASGLYIIRLTDSQGRNIQPIEISKI